MPESDHVLDASQLAELSYAGCGSSQQGRLDGPVDPEHDLLFLKALADLLDGVALGDRFQLVDHSFERAHDPFTRLEEVAVQDPRVREDGSK